MNELLQRLAADWPQRYQPEKADMAFDSRSLRDWIAHLPMANIAATSRQLSDALAAMNRLLLDPQQRLDALEILRPHVAQVVAALERQLAVETLPLPPAKLQLVRQAQDFEAALRLGYVQALRDLVGPQGKVPFLKGRAVTLAALRALQHGAAVLTKAYLAYQAPPPGTWRMLHDVYGVAAGLRCEDKALADPQLGDAELSPRTAYAQALLLELCNPYRFTQRELGDVAALTLAWAPSCALREGLDGAAAFAVHTEADRGVGYLPEDREAGAAGLLAFDVSALREDVEGSLAMLPPGVETVVFRWRGGAPVHASAAFVERVLRAWRGGAERGHARLSAGHHLDVVIGLHGLHFVLAGGEDFDSFLRRVRGQAISLSERDTAAPWTNIFSPDAARPVPQRAKVLDQSLGGYRLRWDSGEALRAKVGELVGLAPPAPEDEPQDWMVGLIRWIRSEADGAVAAGVELLARRAQPVGLATLDEARQARPPMRAVLLCDEDGADGYNLLAPQVFDRASAEVEFTRPADPYDWEGRASVQRLAVLAVADTNGSYQRVIIGESLPLAGLPDDSTPLPLASTGT